jgi:hypothetical protein
MKAGAVLGLGNLKVSKGSAATFGDFVAEKPVTASNSRTGHQMLKNLTESEDATSSPRARG